MVREDLLKVKKFAQDTLRPMAGEIKELQQSLRDEIKEFCEKNDIEKKDFNEAWRRSNKDAPGEVDLMEEAMRGVVAGE